MSRVLQSNGSALNLNVTIINGTIDANDTETLNSTKKNETHRSEASYPEDILTYDQIKKGGFLIYAFGKIDKNNPYL